MHLPSPSSRGPSLAVTPPLSLLFLGGQSHSSSHYHPTSPWCPPLMSPPTPAVTSWEPPSLSPSPWAPLLSSLFLDRQLPPALTSSLVTPSLVVTSFHWPAVSLLCCHALPSMGILPVTSAGLSLSPPTLLSPSYLPHPSVCGLLHCHGPAAAPFPRRTGTPLSGRGTLRWMWSSLSHRPLFWWTRPLPGAGRDWPPGSRAPRRAPPPWELLSRALWDRLGPPRGARGAFSNLRAELAAQKTAPGAGPAPQGRCSHLGGSTSGISEAGAARKAAFVRKFLWVQPRIENCPEGGVGCGRPSAFGAALGPACSPQGQSCQLRSWFSYLEPRFSWDLSLQDTACAEFSVLVRHLQVWALTFKKKKPSPGV